MPDWITIPDAIARPASGAKVSLSSACEWHRDDSTLPSDLTVANGTYKLVRISDVTTVTAAVPVGGSWNFLASYEQTNTIVSSGSATQTTTGVFPSAGTYVVGIATGSDSDLTIDVTGAVTAVVTLVRQGAGGIGLFYVTTSGAGGITVRNNNTTSSNRRIIAVGQATNLTDAGHIEITASGNQTNAQTATLTSVPSGHVVISMLLYSNAAAAAPAITWGGNFDSSNEVMDLATGALNGGMASRVASSTGNFVTSATIAGDDGSYTWRMVSVAMAGA